MLSVDETKEFQKCIGKTIKEIADTSNGMEDWIIIKFTDETSLRIRYDWIYEIVLK